MKIAVIITDATGLVNAGLDVERTVKAFDMPVEMAEYIRVSENSFSSVSFAIMKDTQS